VVVVVVAAAAAVVVAVTAAAGAVVEVVVAQQSIQVEYLAKTNKPITGKLRNEARFKNINSMLK
jgi:hypothetical protein